MSTFGISAAVLMLSAAAFGQSEQSKPSSPPSKPIPLAKPAVPQPSAKAAPQGKQPSASPSQNEDLEKRRERMKQRDKEIDQLLKARKK